MFTEWQGLQILIRILIRLVFVISTSKLIFCCYFFLFFFFCFFIFVVVVACFCCCFCFLYSESHYWQQRACSVRKFCTIDVDLRAIPGTRMLLLSQGQKAGTSKQDADGHEKLNHGQCGQFVSTLALVYYLPTVLTHLLDIP